MDLSCDYLKMKHPIAQKALYALLEVKDSDLRLDTACPLILNAQRLQPSPLCIFSFLSTK